jgi:hypothetical protein
LFQWHQFFPFFGNHFLLSLMNPFHSHLGITSVTFRSQKCPVFDSSQLSFANLDPQLLHGLDRSSREGGCLGRSDRIIGITTKKSREWLSRWNWGGLSVMQIPPSGNGDGFNSDIQNFILQSFCIVNSDHFGGKTVIHDPTWMGKRMCHCRFTQERVNPSEIPCMSHNKRNSLC